MESYLKLLEQYFELIENCSSQTKESFLIRCASLVPMLYVATQELPKSKEIRDEEIDVDRSQVNSPMARILDLLGEEAYYDEVFDPVEDCELVKANIADDLADIYLDLKSGYLKWSTGTEEGMDEALWDWAFSLECHMGDHMVDVMRPIHRMIRMGFNQNRRERVTSDKNN